MLNGCSSERIDQILCATSAVPFLFDPVEIDGVPYSDGGIGLRRDNVPVRPVFEAGCDTIVVIHLSPLAGGQPPRLPRRPADSGGASVGLGFGLNGQLDFDQSHAAQRMEQGYWDGLRQLVEALLNEPTPLPEPGGIGGLIPERDRPFRVGLAGFTGDSRPSCGIGCRRTQSGGILCKSLLPGRATWV